MSEKTEEPTPKKLRDARKKGQVAKSKEVPSALLLVATLILLFAMMPGIVKKLHDLMLLPTKFYNSELSFSANAMVGEAFAVSLQILVPIIATAIVFGIAGHVLQAGVLFTGKTVQPKLSNVNPASAVKRIFGLKNFVEFLKSAFKIGFLTLLLFLVIRDALNELVKIPLCGLACIPALIGQLLWRITIYTAAAFLLVAAIDYFYQRWQFMKEQRMTKDEVKREYKESEGDPHIKSKRKQLAQELAMADTEERVKKASVVVTNPTHIAVAMNYREDITPLPIVVAMGENLRARHIINIAKKAGVPIMQNVPLAHGLYETAQLNQYIPAELIEPVVEVLLWLRDLKESETPSG